MLHSAFQTPPVQSHCPDCSSPRRTAPAVSLQNCRYRSKRSCNLFGSSTQSAKHHQRFQTLRAAAAAAGPLGSFDLPSEGSAESEQPSDALEVFPRIKERDPYRRLAVSREANFEEVQDARNYLMERYKYHEPSKESIDMALDAILQEKIKKRQKYGFKPPKTGRKTDLEGDPEQSGPLQQLKDKLEPNVPSTTLVNDGSIFIALGLWSALQSAAADPTLPLGAAICFCAWRLFDKRKKRSPDGPYWGNSPVWGALATTVLALIFGGLVSWFIVQYSPFPPSFRPEAVGLFLINMILGAACIFFK